MRALSVRQPWAELILGGRKQYEVRSWKPPVLGRILIHASARMDRESALSAGLDPRQLATGALLGTVEVTGWLPFTPDLAASMRAARTYLGEWEAGLYAWEVRDPIKFRNPLAFKGRLGVFQVPDSNLNGMEIERPLGRHVHGSAARSTAVAPAGGVHFVQYHNSAKMGYGCAEIHKYQIFTRKRLSWLENTVLGSTIWLVASEGNPRRYFLCLTFIAEEVGRADSSAFDSFVSAEHGRRFVGLRIDGAPWFSHFRRSQGNFAFGLSRIADEFIPYFENLAKTARNEDA
jgi:hypothetical protein